MRKENLYMVYDCETATLPFANEIAQGDSEKKKRVAIARPLIYDCGWTICNRKGEVKDKKQFLIAETFAVPSVFNTAYYAEKRPIYLEMLKKKEIVLLPWNDVAEIFLEDCQRVKSVGAYNSMFDFKKAIPFTELYIQKLYSPDYQAWEQNQRRLCSVIANKVIRTDEKEDERTFEPDIFKFRGHTFPMFDLWGLAVEALLNNASYKKECLNHSMITASGIYFKTSAESTYRYLRNKYDFDEAHTALEDAEIETYILSQIAKRQGINNGIKYFPFRDLGQTNDFVKRLKVPNMDEVNLIYDAITNYLVDKAESMFTARLENILADLRLYAGMMG